jgi:hypothetical protein
MKRLITYLAIIYFFLLSTQVSIAGSYDIYLGVKQGGAYVTSFGTSQWFYSEAGPTANITYTHFDNDHQIDGSADVYWQFDLSRIRGSINNAILYVRVNNYYGGGPFASVIHVDQSLVRANGDAQQRLNGGDTIFSINNKTIFTHSIDVSNYIKDDLKKHYRWAAFCLNHTINGTPGTLPSFSIETIGYDSGNLFGSHLHVTTTNYRMPGVNLLLLGTN